MRHRLGKLPARHDPRTFKLAAPLVARLPVIPPSCDWTDGCEFQPWGNDQYGDCAFAGQAAQILAWTKAAQAPVSLSTEDCLANYSACTGFNPDVPGSDQGTVLLDALNRWTREGYQRPGQTRDYLTAYGALPVNSIDAICRSIAFLGGVYAGLQLPQYLVDAQGDWSLDPTQSQIPVGGHCVALLGFNHTGLIFNTWGMRKRMAWSAWLAFADEAYGLVSRENWTGITGVSPNKEDLDALVAEMRVAT